MSLFPAIALTALFAGMMLVKDLIWSVQTKAIADGHTGLALICNGLGDAAGRLSLIVSQIIIAAGLTGMLGAAEVIGDVSGGMAGTFLGHLVSVALDRLVKKYHRHPDHNLLGTAGSLGRLQRSGSRAR